MNQDFECPCGSNQKYSECCKQYHQGKIPENALILMRSRYTAYALNLPNYIIETTHKKNPQYKKNKLQWIREITAFSKSTSFERLVILDHQENQMRATVTFNAYLSENGRDCSFSEKSYFEKIGGRWFYIDGKVSKVDT